MGLSAEALSWRFACPDWEERLRDGRSLIPDDLPLNWDEANRAVAIFNKLRLPDVPGQPMMAEAAGEWARDIVRAIFGSLDEEGVRWIREVFELVPKKNAKTTNGAAIMMVALLMNERPRAEFVLIGPTQEIADTAFQQASGMIDADPFLKQRFHVQEHVKTIFDRLTKAKLKIKTFDMKVATGSKPVGILIDELHLMGSIAGAARVIGQLRGGMIANPEAFLIIITTQSDEIPAGVFKAELDYARGVRDGRIVEDVHMLPMLYEFSEAVQTSGAWKNTKLWQMVLPNLGRSITIERLVSEYRTACEKGDEEERRWASQHLNIQIGLALQTDRWRGADYWESSVEPGIATLAALLARCDVAVVGIDGGGLDDLLGLGVVGRDKQSRAWLGWGHAWAQSDVLERRKDIADRLRDFAAAGELTICEEPTQDIRELADIVQEVRDAGLLPEEFGVGLDPIGVAALLDELATRGIDGKQVVAVTQGFRLSPAVWGAERKLKDGTLRHAGQALLAWCVGNAKAEQRGNAVLITKQAAGKAKIDPLVAFFNAVQLMSRNPEAAGSVDDLIASYA
ncbi:terminase large subunit [Sphingomonas sp. ID0503]|uniref:terminase large subunit n=1 Tax=Sphingomonas sp. ID0503 TaxID=3399691 RepID=UPI003AFB0AE3